MRLGRGLLAATILSAAVAACGVPTTTPAGSPATIAPSTGTSATPLPSHIGSVGPFSPADCPIPDAAFCTPAADLADAIVAGDAAAIVALSRPDVFTCADLDATIFTDCASGDVLEGHPIGTAGGNIRVLAPAAYGDELEARMKAIDPSYSDDAGTGEARVLGTSACGPDDPARRSYYVAWTAAGPGGSGDVERHVGLYEFTFRDDQWLVGILYQDTVASWQAQHADPLRDVGCGVAPWGSG